VRRLHNRNAPARPPPVRSSLNICASPDVCSAVGRNQQALREQLAWRTRTDCRSNVQKCKKTTQPLATDVASSDVCLSVGHKRRLRFVIRAMVYQRSGTAGSHFCDLFHSRFAVFCHAHSPLRLSLLDFRPSLL